MNDPSVIFNITDKDEKMFFVGNAHDVVLQLAKSDYMVQVTEEDFINVYMYQMKIRLFQMGRTRIKVTYEDYSGFLSELARVGVIKIKSVQIGPERRQADEQTDNGGKSDGSEG